MSDEKPKANRRKREPTTHIQVGESIKEELVMIRDELGFASISQTIEKLILVGESKLYKKYGD